MSEPATPIASLQGPHCLEGSRHRNELDVGLSVSWTCGCSGRVTAHLTPSVGPSHAYQGTSVHPTRGKNTNCPTVPPTRIAGDGYPTVDTRWLACRVGTRRAGDDTSTADLSHVWTKRARCTPEHDDRTRGLGFKSPDVRLPWRMGNLRVPPSCWVSRKSARYSPPAIPGRSVGPTGVWRYLRVWRPACLICGMGDTGGRGLSVKQIAQEDSSRPVLHANLQPSLVECDPFSTILLVPPPPRTQPRYPPWSLVSASGTRFE